ncbi:hypothetical protein O3P69_006458 [Scylla paramamosain]|uniref:Uncharacterized protein n=1 Tax=Scylla paramamosain TaxID=85552 RepID=A0AAW0U639_SCYPA
MSEVFRDLRLTRKSFDNTLDLIHKAYGGAIQATERAVNMKWMPSHVDITGNARADTLAGQGAQAPEASYDLPTASTSKRTIDDVNTSGDDVIPTSKSSRTGSSDVATADNDFPPLLPPGTSSLHPSARLLPPPTQPMHPGSPAFAPRTDYVKLVFLDNLDTGRLSVLPLSRPGSTIYHHCLRPSRPAGNALVVTNEGLMRGIAAPDVVLPLRFILALQTVVENLSVPSISLESRLETLEANVNKVAASQAVVKTSVATLTEAHHTVIEKVSTLRGSRPGLRVLVCYRCPPTLSLLLLRMLRPPLPPLLLHVLRPPLPPMLLRVVRPPFPPLLLRMPRLPLPSLLMRVLQLQLLSLLLSVPRLALPLPLSVVAFIQFMTVSDVANRDIILDQQVDFGIKVHHLKWIRGYLSNRSSRVFLHGAYRITMFGAVHVKSTGVSFCRFKKEVSNRDEQT